MEQKISRASLWGLSHYTYGEAYFGSCQGMRYRVAREPLVISKEDKDVVTPQIKVSIWPEPMAYAYTEPDLIQDACFPFSEEGMEQACAFLNTSLEKKDFEA